MEIHQLIHFTVAARCEKLLAAAKQLDISQPALTRSIQALEESVGVPLFERDPREVRLTAFGRCFLPHAQAILNECDRASRELQAMSKGHGGQISIGIGSLYTLNIIPTALSLFLKDHASTQIFIREGNVEELLPFLRTGELEFLFVVVPEPITDQAMTFEPLSSEKLIVVSRSKHPLTTKRKITPEDAARYPWIISDQLLLEDKVSKVFFAQYGISVGTNTIVNSKSIPFRRAAVLQSDMLTMMPEQNAAEDIANGTIARIRLPVLEHSLPAGLVYSSQGVRPLVVDELLKNIRLVARRGRRKA